MDKLISLKDIFKGVGVVFILGHFEVSNVPQIALGVFLGTPARLRLPGIWKPHKTIHWQKEN